MAEFLSEEWVKAVREVYAAHPNAATVAPQQVQINLVVKDAPFGDGTVQAHLDTTGGEPQIDLGHIDGAPTTISTDYATAKAVFVEQDQNAAMQAFMGGKIQITGDMTKVMALMQGTPDPDTVVLANELKALTD